MEASSSSSAGAIHYYPLVKSERDQRTYRYLLLPNQLRVLLVSDPATAKAAAALSVQVGANQNPPEREGLAHFLEHMLFLGTQKYPEAGAYQAFIAQHSGSFNAYTAAENTTYFFDIDPAQLEPALDRFAQFFIAPLFTPEYVERERQAVHAEFIAKIKDDGRRQWEVYRELINPQHPSAKFSVGNLQTLADPATGSLRDELLAFYERHYSAELMTLVVVGREGLDQLQAWVNARFTQVPQRELAIADDYPPLFEPGRLPLTVEIQPERDLRQLSFNFPIVLDEDYYARKPFDYIGQILAHEGKGSLLSFLKRLGWADAVNGGVILKSRRDALFQLTLDLTPRGVKAREQLVPLVFYVIEQLRSRGISAWRYTELQDIAGMQFHFQEKQPPMETARQLAEAMFDYPPAQLLRNQYWYGGFDEALISRALDYLRSDNLFLVLMAPEIQPYRISQRYSTPYTVRQSIAPILDLKPIVKQELQLPERNPFLPRRLTVKSNSMLEQVDVDAEQKPQLIFKDRNARVWYAQDYQFEQPKAVLQVLLKSPLVAGSAEAAAQAQLLAAMVNDQLTEFTYPAKKAGIDYVFNANARGFELQVSGFSSRQSLLLNRWVESLVNPRLNAERFEVVKQKLLREWRNRNKNLPYLVMLQQIPALQLDPQWDDRSLIAALEQVDYPALQRFAEHMLLDAKMDMLVYGNYFRQEALKLAVLLDHALLKRQTGREMPPAKALGLSKMATKSWLYHYPIDHSDALVELLIPAASPQIDVSAHMQLLQQIIKPLFYTQLRTEKQLGYVVAAVPMPLRQLDASLLVVQSPVATEAQLVDEINAFLDAQEASIADNLRVNQESLVKKLREPARSLSEQAQRYWQSIILGDYEFTRVQALATAVEQITPESLRAQYRAQFLQKNQRLWFVTRPLPNEDSYNLIEDLPAYKAAQDAYPIP